MASGLVLVVDDEPDIRSTVKEILEDEGYQVVVAENAAVARELRRSTRPDVVLLDIWMPDLDGIEVTPVGLEDVSTYPALIAELLRRGWSPEDVKQVAGLNVLRVMRQVEAVAARLQKERGPSLAQIEVLDHWSTRPPWQGPVK